MAKAKKSKQFEYNLKTVLKYREIKKTQAQDQFNKAQEKFLQEKQKEEALKEEQKNRYSDLAAEMAGGKEVDLQQIFMRKTHLEVLKEQVIRQTQVKEDAEEFKEEKREELVSANKDQKILEKDKEKKQIAWKQLMQKEENKFLDDISSIGYVRNHSMDQS